MSVGLDGDGDELAAVADIEDAFGVRLDHSDASLWLSAGDLFDSLRRALPAGERDRLDLWERFSTTLAAGTGVDPAQIQRDSPLLSRWRFWRRVADSAAVAWIVGVAGTVATIVTAASAGS